MANGSASAPFVRLAYNEFRLRFVRRVVGDIEADRVVYGLRARDYAMRVAHSYWIASLQDQRSPEAWAEDDIAFWPFEHGV